jgi:aspartate/methionine/tyrosine aminotransferase
MGDPRYATHLVTRATEYKRRASEACAILGPVPGITVHEPQGAFYLTVLFDRDVITGSMSLPIADQRVQRVVEEFILHASAEPDFRFVYYLMGATGIVVVPLSSFCCQRHGFRITLLECDDERRRRMFETLARVIGEYQESAVS